MQRPQGFGRRSGLVPVLTERKAVRAAAKQEVMTKLFGPEWEKLRDQSMDLSKSGPSTGEIVTKLNEGMQLTPEEATTLRENPWIENIYRQGEYAFQKAVEQGKSSGARENFWATQRPLAARFYDAVPEARGREGGMSPERWVDRKRFHNTPPRYDAFKAIEDYVDRVVSQDTYDPMISDAKSFVKHLDELQEKGLESVEGERKFVQDFINNQMRGSGHFIDSEAFRRNNRHIVNDSIAVGDEFKSKGLIDPLQPKGKVKVESMEPNGLFKISVDGKPLNTQYTFSELLGMKHESTLANVRPVSSISQFLSTLALGSWVAGDLAKFPVAALSNVTRSLVSESRGYLAEGAQTVLETMKDPAKRKAWFREMEPLDVASPGLLEFAQKGKFATPLWNLSLMNVALPDMLQKPVLFEAARARLRDLNPKWSEQKVKTEALMETALHSDLAGRQFQAPAATHPLGQMAYLFQKSSLRTFDLMNSIWSDTKISTPKRVAKLAALTGIPAATWMGVWYATGADPNGFGRAVRQSLEFLPFLSVVTALPGVTAAVDAMDGKTLNRFARRHWGHDTPYIDVRGWTQGKPRPWHRGGRGEND